MRDMVRLKPQSIPILAAGRCADAKSAFVDRGSTQSRESVDGVDESADTLLKGYHPQALAWIGTLNTTWACGFLEQWPTLQSLQASSRRQILRFYERRPRASLDRHEQLKQIQDAGTLTQDEAVLESSALMVQALVSQLRPLLASIAEFDRKLAMVQRIHSKGPAFRPFVLA